MTNAETINIFLLFAMANLAAFFVTRQIIVPLGRIKKEREQFLAYMRELDAEEAGREVLTKLRSLRELRATNERLKKVCK